MAPVSQVPKCPFSEITVSEMDSGEPNLAPKGGMNVAAVVASLKRCPDTKHRTCLAEKTSEVWSRLKT